MFFLKRMKISPDKAATNLESGFTVLIGFFTVAGKIYIPNI